MSSVSEAKQRLILDLLRHKISEDEFYAAFPMAPGRGPEAALEMLREAVSMKDPVGAEFGLYLAHRFGFDEGLVEALVELSGAAWHQRHEDAVDGLAVLRNPASIPALFSATTKYWPYREYDEARSLETKAVWALAKTGGVEAVCRLGDLLRVEEPIVREQAEARLRDIANEAGSSTSELARRILRGEEGC